MVLENDYVQNDLFISYYCFMIEWQHTEKDTSYIFLFPVD